MGFYKYFYDLEASTSYSAHTIGSFDNNTTTGGGIFKWVSNVSNTAISNIPGIRIKPIASEIGYWERIFDGPINVAWFGCQNTEDSPSTFAQLGVSQLTLDTRYGTSFATTSDCYDTTAIRYAFNLMNTQGYQSLDFEPKKYWINRSCTLPTTVTDSTNFLNSFIIDGKNALIVRKGTSQFNMFSRIPTTATEASTIFLNNSFIIKNFKADGTGGVWQNSGFAFIFVGASTNSRFESIIIENFDIGLRLENCVNGSVNQIFTRNIKTNSIMGSDGSWTSGGLTDGSTNLVIDQCNIVDTLGQPSCILVEVSENVTIQNSIITGIPAIGIKFDSGTVTIKKVNLLNNTINADWTDSAVRLVARGVTPTRFIIDGLEWSSTTAETVITLQTPNASWPCIYFANSTSWIEGQNTLCQISTVNTYGSWDINYVYFGDPYSASGITTPAHVINPANLLWNTVPVGSLIPNVTNVRYVAPISA